MEQFSVALPGWALDTEGVASAACHRGQVRAGKFGFIPEDGR